MTFIAAVERRTEGYSSNEVVELTGVTYKMLDYWDRRDVISPVTPAAGSGSRRRYSAEQVEEVALAMALRRLGMPLDTVDEVLREARAYSGTESMVITDTDIRAARKDEIAMVVAAAGGVAVVVVNNRRDP